MSKLLTGLLGLAAGTGAGYGIGASREKKRSRQHIEEAKQVSELATKLRERAESSNRRLRLENYYVRKALNELARKRISDSK